MVDFNNETTIATPPGEIIKIVILERREQVIESIEYYYRAEGSNADLSHKVTALRATVLSLWYELQAMVQRRLDAQAYEEVEQGIKSSKKFEDLILSFEWLNKFIDEIGLTYIDTRVRYDRSRVEDANIKKGL